MALLVKRGCFSQDTGTSDPAQYRGYERPPDSASALERAWEKQNMYTPSGWRSTRCGKNVGGSLVVALVPSLFCELPQSRSDDADHQQRNDAVERGDLERVLALQTLQVVASVVRVFARLVNLKSAHMHTHDCQALSWTCMHIQYAHPHPHCRTFRPAFVSSAR